MVGFDNTNGKKEKIELKKIIDILAIKYDNLIKLTVKIDKNFYNVCHDILKSEEKIKLSNICDDVKLFNLSETQFNELNTKIDKVAINKIIFHYSDTHNELYINEQVHN